MLQRCQNFNELQIRDHRLCIEPKGLVEMNFLERRSLKRIQLELSRFLTEGESIVDFDLSDFMMLNDENGIVEVREGSIRIAISNFAVWIALPASSSRSAQVLQASWDEILEFSLNHKIRAYEVILIDGRKFYFNTRFPRNLQTNASEQIRKVESQMSSEQISNRRELLSIAKSR